MSGSSGRHRLTSKFSKSLSEDEQNELALGIRLLNGPIVAHQPAQDRLKRFQTNLKRLQDKAKPNQMRERERTKMAAKRARRSSSASEKIKRIDAPPIRRRASSSGSRRSLTERLTNHQVPTTPRVSSSRNAWEKPMALLEASNRNPTISANQRLSLLTATLQQKQKEQKAKPEMNNNQVPNAVLKAGIFDCSASESDVAEPMDWEESMEDQSEGNEILLVRQATNDEELPPRRLDHMYFVLDTNVLMHNIKFVESLAKVVLPGTVGSMLYIPYIVIKELDKLKAKNGDENAKRQLAVRAIRYLNTQFDESLDIQAQSAVDAAEHLIEVDCPDDSIVNCCLQLKEEVPHMMLLTNDANLRLKGNANNIEVSCRSDLMAQYHNEFAAVCD
ncbi:hypothetical protein KR074_006382 [Drosophila pseudoananassae]|nr:hypothetical protein KR074_006382 [Drosophila pseudoananassae]